MSQTCASKPFTLSFTLSLSGYILVDITVSPSLIYTSMLDISAITLIFLTLSISAFLTVLPQPYFSSVNFIVKSCFSLSKLSSSLPSRDMLKLSAGSPSSSNGRGYSAV